MSEDLLKPKEVQDRLGVSRGTLYDWHHKKRFLQPKKIGGSLRYTEEDVEKFVNGECLESK